MEQPFNENIFSALLQTGRMEKVVEGLKGNLHFAFEFNPSCGEADFARAFSRRLANEPVLLFSADLRMTTTADQLVKNLSRSFLSAFAGNLKKMESVLKKLIPTATTKIVMAETPYIDVQYGTDLNRIFANLLDVPEMMGTEENKRAVVVWEGFDNLKSVMGEEGLRTFVAKARGQAITSHVIIGTGVEGAAKQLGGQMLNQVLTVPSGDLAAPEEIKDYIRRGFILAGIEPPDSLPEEIYAAADARIEIIKTLSRAVIRNWAKSSPAGVVREALDEIVAGADSAYGAVWRLLNPRQKSVLHGLCRENVKNIYSESFIRQYGFHTATNLQAALRALDQKRILVKRGKKWEFADPLFRHWICRCCGFDSMEIAG